jgi:hypothetical protein
MPAWWSWNSRAINPVSLTRGLLLYLETTAKLLKLLERVSVIFFQMRLEIVE